MPRCGTSARPRVVLWLIVMCVGAVGGCINWSAVEPSSDATSVDGSTPDAVVADAPLADMPTVDESRADVVGADTPGACGAASQPCCVTIPRCQTGVACSSGTCAACSSGRTACFSRCVDLQTDDSNCGMCGQRCTGGTSCRSGACM